MLDFNQRKELLDAAYQEVADELRAGEVDEGLMMRASSECSDNPSRTRARYVQLRYRKIYREYKREANKWSIDDTLSIVIIILFIPILSGLYLLFGEGWIYYGLCLGAFGCLWFGVPYGWARLASKKQRHSNQLMKR